MGVPRRCAQLVAFGLVAALALAVMMFPVVGGGGLLAAQISG